MRPMSDPVFDVEAEIVKVYSELDPNDPKLVPVRVKLLETLAKMRVGKAKVNPDTGRTSRDGINKAIARINGTKS